MGDLDKNIYRKQDSSAYEKIIVNPIEKDRREEQGKYSTVSHSGRSQVFAAIASYIKKIVTVFADEGKEHGTTANIQHVLDYIKELRQRLIQLTKEDVSHDPEYTIQLSQAWHRLLDSCNTLSPIIAVTSEPVYRIKFFISQVQNYPPGADHTLGYYFNQYAGKEWIPFPFMELLQSLHEESLANPLNSVLQHWIHLLNDILPIPADEKS